MPRVGRMNIWNGCTVTVLFGVGATVTRPGSPCPGLMPLRLVTAVGPACTSALTARRASSVVMTPRDASETAHDFRSAMASPLQSDSRIPPAGGEQGSGVVGGGGEHDLDRPPGRNGEPLADPQLVTAVDPVEQQRPGIGVDNQPLTPLDG